MADSYCLIAALHRAIAPSAKTQASEREVRWREARAGYQRALDMWNELLKQGVKPANADCPPDQLSQQIAKCDAELKKSSK